MVMSHPQTVLIAQTETQTLKEKIEYLGHSVSSKGVWPSRDNLKAIAKYPNQ